MSARPTIELVYFRGCPHAQQGRDNVGAAVLQAFGEPVEWAEWDVMEPSTPEHYKGYGSPTVLVDGQDVTGVGPTNADVACRAEGAPSVAEIVARLS